MKIEEKIHQAISLEEDDLKAEQILQRFGWKWFWFGFIFSTIIFSLTILWNYKNL